MPRNIASKDDIRQFLSIFKKNWDGQVVPRLDEKNDETLIILGIQPKHRMEIIKNLKIEDYFRGPTPDHDGDNNKKWWEFGKHIKHFEIYIKLRIYKRTNGSYGGKCMSFHIAEHAISYPYKEKG